MDINIQFQQLEEKWLAPLNEECKRIFQHSHIPSHDFEHSKRVWSNAKLLIGNIAKTGYELELYAIESIMIACFFHDTGLTVSIGEKHGKASSELCAKYFKLNSNPTPLNLSSVLNIIEFHENKEYGNKLLDTFSANSILAITNDSDAFGYTGIYRYAEIYLMRNINLSNLAEKVLKNLDNRFNNIITQFGKLKDFCNETERRYNITRTFYCRLAEFYSNKLNAYTNSFIEIIEKEIINNKKTPILVFKEHLTKTSNPELIEFLTCLIAEEKDN